MTLENYIKQLQEIISANQEHSKLTVIYAADDEGNDFKKIGFAPSLGNLDVDGEFTQQENFEDIDEENRVINVICIN